MTALSASFGVSQARTLFPGVMACAVVAAAATFLADHYGAPVMLFALLLGLAMNFLSGEGPCAAGIAFTGRTVLRLGVALLGLRITVGQIAELGWQPLLIVVLSVVLTIGVSMLLARTMGFQSLFGLLSGGATAICGASAALALAAALPNHPLKERATLFTVIGVSVLSTLTMIVYPMLAKAIGLDPRMAGVFLGATIHDVAQVVGAGYSVSHEAGDAAVLTKMLRVAMLLPVVLVLTLVVRHRFGTEGAGRGDPLFPPFLIVFMLLVAAGSAGLIPTTVAFAMNDVARACLVVAIAAVGLKTSPLEMKKVGGRAIALLAAEALFLAALVVAAQKLA